MLYDFTGITELASNGRYQLILLSAKPLFIRLLQTLNAKIHYLQALKAYYCPK